MDVAKNALVILKLAPALWQSLRERGHAFLSDAWTGFYRQGLEVGERIEVREAGARDLRATVYSERFELLLIAKNPQVIVGKID